MESEIKYGDKIFWLDDKNNIVDGICLSIGNHGWIFAYNKISGTSVGINKAKIATKDVAELYQWKIDNCDRMILEHKAKINMNKDNIKYWSDKIAKEKE